jgi:transcription antitermination factor NusA-like protein
MGAYIGQIVRLVSADESVDQVGIVLGVDGDRCRVRNLETTVDFGSVRKP